MGITRMSPRRLRNPVKISPLFGLGLHNGESHVVVRTGSYQFGPKIWNDLHLDREFGGKFQSFDEKCGFGREEITRVNRGCRDGYVPFQLQLPRFVSGKALISEIIDGRSRDDVGGELILCDVDELHRTIVDNAGFGRDLEGLLDSSSVPLTTDLVVEILHRLRFDEKVAFRFFTWAGKQEEYCHEYRVYNDMIDILSSTKYKAKQFRIVCDMLDYMKRNKKKSVPLEVLLTILRSYTEKYLTHVQKFTKKKRIRVKMQPEINAFNLLLDALCKCSLVEDAESMFMKVKKKVRPNANAYTILFFGWCRVRNPKRGMKLLEEMIAEGFTPDNFTYDTGIDTFFKEGMVNEATEIFEFMKKQALPLSSPTAKTYSIMILAFVANDRIEECFRVVDEMIKSGCLPDVSTYKELIEGMYMSGKVDETYRFLEEMGKKGYPPDIVTYNCFLKVLCDNKKSEEALDLYSRMIEAGCEPSVHTYNMLVEMFFAMDDPDGAFKTWQEMEIRGCFSDANTYCLMIEGLFKCNKADDALYLLGDVFTRGIKLPFQRFDSFMMQLSELGDLSMIQKLSEHMKKFYNPAMARRFSLSQKRKSISLRGK